MAQLDADQYLRLTPQVTYGQSDGLFYDKTNGLLVLVIADSVVFSVASDGTILAGDLEAPDLSITGQTQGDLLRYSGSEWERLAAVTAGKVVMGDGTDVTSLAISGDATLAGTGALTVTDVTVGSDAQGDLQYKSSATALARLAIGTAQQILAVNSGATAPEWVNIVQGMSLRVPSASGIDTDAYNGGLAGCENAGDITLTDIGATNCKVWDNSATAYANLETASAGDFVQWQLFPNNTQDTDAVYFGSTTPFAQIYLDISATNQTYTGDATTWEYYNGASFTTLTLAHDYTDATAQDGNRSFGRDGSIQFVPPSDWDTTAIDGVTRYWIRCNAGTAANISQVGITNSVRHKVATPTDGFIAPVNGTITDITIRDEAGTVHTAADIKFILMNFTTGAHSGELTFAQDKRSDTFGSLTLTIADGDNLGVLITQEDGTNEMGPFTLEITTG